VLLPLATELRAADERMAVLLDAGAVAAVVALVPDDWLGEDPEAARAEYVQYLCARLQAPRGFVEEAEAARGA
jgi:hypothetical protein